MAVNEKRLLFAAEGFAYDLAQHAQQQVAGALAHVQVFVPELDAGRVVQVVGLYSAMKPKQCVNLAVVLHSFGFVYGQRLV
jgi:hypothetical protein